MYTQERHERGVRIHTTAGRIEGNLKIAASLRTLDDLNLVAKRLVTLHSAHAEDANWPFDSGALSVNKDSILFMMELGSPAVQAGVQFGRFTRSPVRLRVGTYDVQGFVHVPPGGVAMKRLDQDNHPFVSLTSVLVSGPEGEFTAPFLAVNRSHIIAAQEVEHPVEEESAELATAEVTG